MYHIEVGLRGLNHTIMHADVLTSPTHIAFILFYLLVVNQKLLFYRNTLTHTHTHTHTYAGTNIHPHTNTHFIIISNRPVNK
jgi:hypothetical protein